METCPEKVLELAGVNSIKRRTGGVTVLWKVADCVMEELASLVKGTFLCEGFRLNKGWGPLALIAGGILTTLSRKESYRT